MKKLCVVPFTGEAAYLLHCPPQEYILESLVVPKGIAFTGDDAAAIINGAPTGFIVTNSVNDSINAADTVLIPAISQEKPKLRVFAFDALRTAIEANKEIFCFMEISDAEREKWGLGELELSVPGFGNSQSSWAVSSQELDKIMLHTFDIPVLYIGELTDHLDSYSVFLKVASKFQSCGKNVLAISDDSCNVLYGFSCFDFGNATELGFYRQAKWINHQLYQIAKSVRPDLIIIKLPKPILLFDEKVPSDCGVSAFIISQAMPGSGCVICSPVGLKAEEFWRGIAAFTYYRFGYPLEGIHVSNQFIDRTTDRPISMLRISSKSVQDEIDLLNRSSDFNYYNLLDDMSLGNFVKKFSSNYLELKFGVI